MFWPRTDKPIEYHIIDINSKYPNREIPQPQPQPQRNGNPSTPPRANRPQSENQQPPSPPRRRRRRAPSPGNERNSNSTFDETLVGHDWDVSTIALGVHRRATDREIKSSFRRLCMKFHPDKYSPNFGISPEQGMAMFQMYNNAYESLKDPPNQPR